MSTNRKPLLIAGVLALAAAAAIAVYYFEQRGESPSVVAERSLEAAPEEPAVSEQGPVSDEEAALAPTFDIIRVEPTGDMVAAGRSGPEAAVEVLVDREVRASAQATPEGEWAAMVAGLPIGTHDVLLRAKLRGGGEWIEGDHAAVVIEGPGRTPLVAVTRPGKPSRVVQTPEAEASGEEGETTTLALVTPEGEAAAGTTGGGDGVAGSADGASGTDAGRAAAGGERLQPDGEGAQQAPGSDRDRATGTDETAGQHAAPMPADQAPGQRETGPSVSMPAQSEGSGPSEVMSGRQGAAGSADDAPAGGDSATAGGAAPAQGTTEPPAIARTAAAPAGESGDEAAQGPGEEERADRSSATGSADRTDTGTATPDRVQESSGTGASPSAEGTDDAAPVGASEAVSIETVEVEDERRLMISGRAEAGAALRIYVNNEAVGEIRADQAGRFAAVIERAMPPGQYSVRIDMVGNAGNVLARSEVRFDRVQVAFADATGTEERGASDAAVSVSGTAESGAEAAASADASIVLINRGDNLWRIARKLYGKGVRYTVIYEANRNQIRNPHLIYPGQVFTIPRDSEDGTG